MTYRETINKYLRPDVAEAMLKCTPDCGNWDSICTSEIRLSHLGPDISTLINRLLTWTATPQGHGYWRSIYDSLNGGQTQYLHLSYRTDSIGNKEPDLLLL